MKLYGFKPLKHQKTSITNLQRRRTHEEHEEERISNKLIAKDLLSFCFKGLQSILQPNQRIFGVQVKIKLLQFQPTKSFNETESKGHSFVTSENCIIHSSIQIHICETILLV